MLKQINISELVNGNRGVYNLYRCVWHLVNNTKQANNKDNTYLYKNGLSQLLTINILFSFIHIQSRVNVFLNALFDELESLKPRTVLLLISQNLRGEPALAD
jgi:hypothetical protein